MSAQVQEQFRQKMEHYFTKIYTDKDMEMRPEVVKSHMIGKPVWYDYNGELMVEGIAKRCNVEPSVIRTNFENWKRSGGKAPTSAPTTPEKQEIKRMEAPTLEVPEYKRTVSTGFEDDIRSTIETTRLLKELDGTSQTHIAPPSDMSGIAAIITALKPQGGGSETGTMALIAKMQENATVRQQEGFQQSLQMQNNMTNMMMQMMQNNTNMMLGLVQNNDKPATDSKLVDFALSSLMSPQSSPEDGLVREFIGSGQAAEVARAIGDGLAGVVAARTVPTTAPPSYITQQTLPDPTAMGVGGLQPQPQVSQQGPTTEEKCSALMQRFYDNLTPEFRDNEQYIEVLGRQVEVAINYSEERGGSVQEQLAMAERNMNLIVNLRPICAQVKQIADGTIPMAAAVSYLQTNPISKSFIGSDYNSLIDLLTRFTAADPPGQKMLAWDVDYLRTEKAQSVVKILLEELNRGVTR